MADIAVITRKLDLVPGSRVQEILTRIQMDAEVKCALSLGKSIFVEYKGQAYIILPDDNKRKCIVLE